MIKLAVGICGYQDIKGLRRLVESLPKEHIFAIFYVDGKYPLFDAENEESNDGSIEYIVHEARHDLRVVSKLSKDEVIKRNRYLELCKMNNIDYLLILDTDEYVMPGANWDEFKRNCEQICSLERGHFYGVKFVHQGEVDYPRLWYKPAEVEYYRNHNIFRHKKTGAMVKSGGVVPIIVGITCTNNDDLREVDYINRSYIYQTRLIQKEIATKRELGFSRQHARPWTEIKEVDGE